MWNAAATSVRRTMHFLPLLGIIVALAAVPSATGESSAAPKAPTDLTLTAATDAGLSVTWRASRPRGGHALAGYRVYLDGNRPNASAAVDVTAEITKFEFTSLRCGTSYTVGVVGVNDAGFASEVAAITTSTSPCTTDTTAPTSPSGLVQTASGDASVTVSWTAAGDATGVAGYSLALNGADAGATTQTSHTFSSLACGSSYTIDVVAYDAAGNRSAPATATTTTASCPAAAVPTTTTTSTPPATSATSTASEARIFTFEGAADARVEEASPTANYGRSSLLRVDGADDPDVQSYLRFSVAGTNGNVTSAKLRIYATSSTTNGPSLYGTSNSWDERGITWSNRPAPVGGANADVGSVSGGTWVEWDATGIVTGDGTYSFVLIGESTDGLNMSSREGTRPPQLVVSDTSAPTSDSTPPTAPTSLLATGSTASSIALAWTRSTDNVGVEGYHVYRSEMRVASTSDTAYTVAGLTCGTTYVLAVEAYDAAGNVSPRASVSASSGGCEPTPTPGLVTFVGDAETGSASQWCYVHSALPVGVVTSPVRDGQYAYKSEVRDGAMIYDTERSEYSNGPNTCNRDKFVEGEETWTAVSVYLAPDFPSYTHWSLVAQFKKPFGGTPPQQINLQNDRWNIVGAASISPRPKWSLGGVQRGRWTDFLLHHKWSPNAGVGFVEVYVNGVLALPKTFTKTMDDANPLFLSVGYYRDTSPTTGPATLYIDAVRVGTTRDAVSPR